jgi:hypothetical protein
MARFGFEHHFESRRVRKGRRFQSTSQSPFQIQSQSPGPVDSHRARPPRRVHREPGWMGSKRPRSVRQKSSRHGHTPPRFQSPSQSPFQPQSQSPGPVDSHRARPPRRVHREPGWMESKRPRSVRQKSSRHGHTPPEVRNELRNRSSLGKQRNRNARNCILAWIPQCLTAPADPSCWYDQCIYSAWHVHPHGRCGHCQAVTCDTP